MEKDPSVKKGKPPVKFIVPPLLISHFFRFLDHFKVSQDEPVMIVGDTGVGKSMFLQIFIKLFREKNGAGVPIIEANCAHFSKELSVSELFGHVKGAFTGAINNKKGLVSLAENGVLILEEIGELPDWVQAQLLTFIDTGRYRGVGDEAEKIAKVRIVGATNNVGSLRNDFKYRFYPFYVPSLHERRGDVLYYFANSFPELLLTLTKAEVLALLAYNWPGNVREIDRVARLMLLHKMESDRIFSNISFSENDTSDYIRSVFYTRGISDHINVYKHVEDDNITSIPGNSTGLDFLKEFAKEKDRKNNKKKEIVNSVKKEFGSKRLVGTDPRYTFLDANVGDKIIERVATWGCRTDLLEKYLNYHDVGLTTGNYQETFKFIKNDDPYWPLKFEKYDNTIDQLEIKLLFKEIRFESAYQGFIIFCELFGLDSTKNSNILLDAARGKYDFMPKTGDTFIIYADIKMQKILPKMVNVSKAIMRSLLEVCSDNNQTDNLKEYWQNLLKQKEQQILEQENKMFGSKNFDNIWTMKEDELRKAYYEGLLNRSGGNVSRVAKMLGIPLGSLNGRLDKLGVQHGRKYQKELKDKLSDF